MIKNYTTKIIAEPGKQEFVRHSESGYARRGISISSPPLVKGVKGDVIYCMDFLTPSPPDPSSSFMYKGKDLLQYDTNYYLAD